MGTQIIPKYQYLSEELFDGEYPPGKSRQQLQQFRHHGEEIQNCAFLGKGVDAIVVLGSIGGENYVLKLFRHWQQPSGLLPPDDSPFANECRTFAYLDAAGENGTWAVKCHGWMKASEDQLHTIGKAINGLVIDDEDITIDLCSGWIIVKDYIPEPTNPSHIPEIVQNFGIPKRCKIIPDEVWPDNYRASKMVDLARCIMPGRNWHQFRYDWFYTKTIYGVNEEAWFPNQDPKRIIDAASVQDRGIMNVEAYEGRSTNDDSEEIFVDQDKDNVGSSGYLHERRVDGAFSPAHRLCHRLLSFDLDRELDLSSAKLLRSRSYYS